MNDAYLEAMQQHIKTQSLVTKVRDLIEQRKEQGKREGNPIPLLMSRKELDKMIEEVAFRYDFEKHCRF